MLILSKNSTLSTDQQSLLSPCKTNVTTAPQYTVNVVQLVKAAENAVLGNQPSYLQSQLTISKTRGPLPRCQLLLQIIWIGYVHSERRGTVIYNLNSVTGQEYIPSLLSKLN